MDSKKILDWGLVPISCKNKRPLEKKWTEITAETCVFKITKGTNLGVITGKVSGITVVDIDTKDGGIDWWNKQMEKYGEPETPKVLTGGGGYHYYFKYNGKFKSKSRYNGIGIDVKNDGGFVVCPPSDHQSGGKYTWIRNFDEVSPIEIPEWLNEWLNKNNRSIKLKVPSTQNHDCQVLERNHTQKLLDLIDPKRADEYDTWVQVGMALHSADKDFFHLWEKWSQNSSKYVPGICVQKWDTFGGGGKDELTIGTIHHWAEMDNPDGYLRLKQEECFRRCVNDLGQQNVEFEDIRFSDGQIIGMDSSIHCRISGIDHIQPSNFYTMHTRDRTLSYSCRDKDCFGKCQSMGIVKNTYNILFNINNHYHYHSEGERDTENVLSDKYPIFEDDELNSMVGVAMRDQQAHDYAKIMWYLNRGCYNFVKKGDKSDLYHFDGSRWVVDDLKFLDWLDRDLPNLFHEVRDYFQANELPESKSAVRVANQVLVHLKKPGIEKQVRDKLYLRFRRDEPDFESKLDQNPYLVGFDNGVFDLKTLKFRPGLPDDYLTLSTGYLYSPEYSENKVNLDEFLSSIQPEQNERDYMLTYIATALCGINHLETFHILSGCGRNGKSKFSELVGYTFGDYFSGIPANLLTKEQPSACSPRPELLHLKHKRMVVASEPESQQRLNSSFVKLLSGNDTITARGLYESSMMSFIPQFSLSLLCNDVPEFDRNDQAIWDRCRCIEFPTKFVANPTEDFHRKIDYHLKDKIPTWKNDFFLTLIEYYRKYLDSGLHPTKTVLRFTQKIQEESDIYKCYLEERTEAKKGTNVHCKDLWDDFQSWYKDNRGRNVPKKSKFLKEIQKYYLIATRVRSNNRVSTQMGIKDLSILDT